MWTCTLMIMAAVAVASGAQLYVSAPAGRGQYHRGSSGSYNYGYNTGDGVAKVEVKRPDGSVVGSYRYFDPNGKQIVRSYVADSKGFRILGNDLPISPDTPAAAIVGAPALTAPVEGAANEVVDSSINPSKRFNTVDIAHINTQPLLRHYYQQQTVFQQQNDLLKQQQRIIEEQQQQLASLRNTNVVYSPATNIQRTVNDFIQYNTIDETEQNDAPYYFNPLSYNYDFPAGFAYGGGLVRVEPRQVIGVQQANVQEPLAVGRSDAVPSHRLPPLEVVSRFSRRNRPTFVAGRT
ncbi:uncharacterized protein LOC108673355 [Hyalella azteca]|uniref:Uncharacterized protein LOC108673355 n=1 Tax=Hyalella azteca TaxID=294128 RepID=A0A8B7NSD2_HYAAZ|nr:uncharacterized protein LOC108673355 [Hyalella azteca]